MIAENPHALSYILSADMYLLPHEKAAMPALDIPEAILTELPPEAVTIPEVKEPLAEYNEPVTAPQPQVPTVTETPANTFNYMGGYQSKFLILVHYPEHEIMDPGHLTALENTIKRKELKMEDVAIVNLAVYQGTDLRTVGGFFKPEKMLFLGKDAVPPGFKTPLILNQLTKLGNCNFLYSFSFGEMIGNKDNTKAFWEQMKML